MLQPIRLPKEWFIMSELERVAVRAAKSQPKQSGCVDCDPLPNIEAVIVYPSLATPLLLTPGQTTCLIYIVTTAQGKTAFAFDKKSDLSSCYAPIVGEHLRVHAMTEKLMQKGDGKRFTDAPSYSSVKSAVKQVRWVGNTIVIGKVFKNQAETLAFTLSTDFAKIYPSFSEVIELTIDLTQAPFSTLLTNKAHSFAWIIKCGKQKEKNKINWEHDYIHCNDKYIRAFLQEQAGGAYQHHDSFTLFNLDTGDKATITHGYSTPDNQLWAWHPVVLLKTASPLKIAHFSDVHVNVRQNTLAQSPACMLEGASGAGELSQPVAQKLTNTFNALKDLLEKSYSQSDLIAITGDLIDFNRNLIPDAKERNTLTSYWQVFNILARITDKKYYQRGFDDMLVYGLIRDAYTSYNHPVFLTSGNHEAYQIPYGISPRVGFSGAAQGVTDKPNISIYIDVFKNNPSRHSINGLNEWVRQKTDDDIEAMSEYHGKRANEGIAADHNLTIYEAILAYGPTYAQVIATENFNHQQLSWFHALFSPLDNCCIPIGQTLDKPHQLLVGLAWGDSENYKNISGWTSYTGLSDDKQGVGVLPRADQSINSAQKDLLTMAQKAGKATQAKVCVFSHFTFFNYDYDIPFNNIPRSLPIESGAFNKANVGTCEQNREWFFKACMNQGIHYHFSGHSHRAGVYTAHVGYGRGYMPISVTTALDPAFQNYTADANKTTFVVSSSGGPIGVQNFDGFYITRPPSGTIVDTLTGKVSQLKTLRDGKPRLCVLLDYLHLLQGHRFMDEGTLLGGTFKFSIASVIADLDCISGVNFWMFENYKTESSDKKNTKWIKIISSNLIINKKNQQCSVNFAESDCQKIINFYLNKLDQRLIARKRLICQIDLKPIKKAWGVDINHESPWLFPVHIYPCTLQGTKLVLSICRPEGELGEVPDWKWLAKNFADKYPSERKVIFRAG